MFADFINPNGIEAAAWYRERFQPSSLLAKPRTAIAAWVICADTDEEAFRLSLSMRMMSVLLFRGRPIAVPAIERAQEFLAGEGVPPETLPMGRRIITGSPDKVRPAVERLASAYGAEEVMIVNILHDHIARRRSYELLAEAFHLRYNRGNAETSDLLCAAANDTPRRWAIAAGHKPRGGVLPIERRCRSGVPQPVAPKRPKAACRAMGAPGIEPGTSRV